MSYPKCSHMIAVMIFGAFAILSAQEKQVSTAEKLKTLSISASTKPSDGLTAKEKLETLFKKSSNNPAIKTNSVKPVKQVTLSSGSPFNGEHQKNVLPIASATAQTTITDQAGTRATENSAIALSENESTKNENILNGRNKATMILVMGVGIVAAIVLLIIYRRSTMKWFYNLRIGTKLMTSFSLVAVIAAIVGLFGFNGINKVKEAKDGIYMEHLLPISELGDIGQNVLTIRGHVLAASNAPTPAMKEKYTTQAESIAKDVDGLVEKFGKNKMTKEEQSSYNQLKENWGKYHPIVTQACEYIAHGKSDAALALIYGPGLQPVTDTRAALKALVLSSQQASEETNKASDEAIATTLTSMILILCVGVVIAIALGVFISKIISKPVNDVIANIDNADLNSQFNSDRQDEIGGLQRSFDKFVTSIKDTLLQVAEASSAVASASSQISSSTEEMAAGAQEQTSQAGEVASAVEEMTKTIVENSRNASSTADTAKQARMSAEEGGKIVEETVTGMKRIAEVVNKSAVTVKALGHSSDQIGEIIGVIDDIADQTNLLALNAAIEAARAGEQGRGFAVVADEVRKLAERTTKATKEIADMIKKIQSETIGAVSSMEEGTKEVDSGIKLADKAGSSLNEIVTTSQKVMDMVTQIAAASEEQSSASEQISKNVEAISSVTSESAQGTQQIARAAEDLNRLTENLQQLVGKFNLSTDGTQRTHSKQYKAPTIRAEHKSKIAVKENGSLVHQG
jgi:methyl-accepting chemotaxis protein